MFNDECLMLNEIIKGFEVSRAQGFEGKAKNKEISHRDAACDELSRVEGTEIKFIVKGERQKYKGSRG